MLPLNMAQIRHFCFIFFIGAPCLLILGDYSLKPLKLELTIVNQQTTDLERGRRQT